MPELNTIPVIDIFAGPGGLGEGFSSISYNRRKIFNIKLSIEKDKYAHETLELRSFFRKFKKGQAPKEYYDFLQELDPKKRKNLKEVLLLNYPKEYQLAKDEAWHAELGSDNHSSKDVDLRITRSLNGEKKWVLLGGPPCQAFSLVGRSRVGGINENDNRVFLYKEYLRIIAEHQPSIFVMENVKGLLSAKVKGENVFDLIRRDLSNPASIFKNSKSKKYKIYSFVNEPDEFKGNGFPIYNDAKSFTIKSENFGIPQKRHRVILLGIREDIEQSPRIIPTSKVTIKLKNVINDLPKIRSGLHRKFIRNEIINGKKKRIYEKVEDGEDEWSELVNSYRNEIISWNGLDKKEYQKNITTPSNGKGAEFVKYTRPKKNIANQDWYCDPKLLGACNHEARSHLIQDLKRYLFASLYSDKYKKFPRLHDYEAYSETLVPNHESAKTGKFVDRFRVQLPNEPATTVTSHISKDGHYFIHYDPKQCRSLTVREAARIQTFPDNYLFCGPRTAQYHQVGNAVPPYLAKQIAEIVLNILNH